jgi:hypothetical protein
VGPTWEEPLTARLVREIPDAGNAPPVLFRVLADGRLRPLGLRADDRIVQPPSPPSSYMEKDLCCKVVTTLEL